jgi:Domain of unknown function (DUF4062)
MRERKLQIFLSSTYEDLIDHRLAAMETILAAGHIPAAMEQFAPGDETAWEKITAWIDESDAFILILGGRYGSIEPKSGKSYVQMEYEYAIEKRKPFFSLVVSDKHHAERVQELGLEVDEREKQEMYREFRSTVTERLCRFWDDQKDIESAIFQKLPEWAQRPELVGWVRSDEATNAETTNELARLSSENRELRAAAKASGESFSGLGLDDLVRLLSEHKVSQLQLQTASSGDFRWRPRGPRMDNLLEVFIDVFDVLKAGPLVSPNGSVLDDIGTFGLVQRISNTVALTADGRRFRNQLLAAGKFRTSS